MATVHAPLTFEQFEQLYAGSARAFEYWDGEVVEKAVPTWLHAALQALLCEILHNAGYRAGSEVDLRLNRQFAPRPDVIAGRKSILTRYPTEASQVEVVVEILSPEDAMSSVLEKCEKYVSLGVEQIYVADPESKTAWVWNRERRQLDRVETWTLTNGVTIALAEVWRELEVRR